MSIDKAKQAALVRANIAAMSDDKLLEMREVFATMANTDRVVNEETETPNVLSVYEVRKFGSDFLAALDGGE